MKKYLNNLNIYFYIIVFPLISAYETYSALNALIFNNLDVPAANIHSEYYFGLCATRYKTELITKTFYYKDLENKLIYRSWLHLNAEPDCVYIRGESSLGDLVKYDALKFGVCLCDIVYSHQGRKYVYYYFEWFLPLQMKPNIVWHVTFYRTAGLHETPFYNKTEAVVGGPQRGPPPENPYPPTETDLSE